MGVWVEVELAIDGEENAVVMQVCNVGTSKRHRLDVGAISPNLQTQGFEVDFRRD